MKICSKLNSVLGAVVVILTIMFATSSCRRETQSARSRVMDAGVGESVNMLIDVSAASANTSSLAFTYTFAPEVTGFSAQALSLQWTDVPSTAVKLPETGKKQVALKPIGVVGKLDVKSEAVSLVCLSKDLLVGEAAIVYCTNTAVDVPKKDDLVFKNPESLNASEAAVWVKYVEACKANGVAYGTAAGELTGCYCSRPDVQIPYPRVTEMNPVSFAAYFDKFTAECSAALDSTKGLDLDLAKACTPPHKTDPKISTCTCGNGLTGTLTFAAFKQSSTAVVDFGRALGKLCSSPGTSTATKETLSHSCSVMPQNNKVLPAGCYCTRSIPNAVEIPFSVFEGKSDGLVSFESVCSGKNPYIPATAEK